MLRGIAEELTGQHAAGTLAWKAPETFIGRYSPASDVFGLAVTWFEVLSRQQPFEGLTQPEIIENDAEFVEGQEPRLCECQPNSWATADTQGTPPYGEAPPCAAQVCEQVMLKVLDN